MPPATTPIFADESERRQAIISGAGVALHGLLSSRTPVTDETLDVLIAQAFTISQKFWARAEAMLQ